MKQLWEGCGRERERESRERPRGKALPSHRHKHSHMHLCRPRSLAVGVCRCSHDVCLSVFSVTSLLVRWPLLQRKVSYFAFFPFLSLLFLFPPPTPSFSLSLSFALETSIRSLIERARDRDSDRERQRDRYLPKRRIAQGRVGQCSLLFFRWFVALPPFLLVSLSTFVAPIVYPFHPFYPTRSCVRSRPPPPPSQRVCTRAPS